VTWIDEHLLVVAARSWRDRRRRSKIAATTAAVPIPAKEPDLNIARVATTA
jgi:hypothetical protein